MSSICLVDYSSDDENSTEENVLEENSTTEEWLRGRLLNKIISDVVNVCEERENKEALMMTVDRNPSFDVYRPKQRLMSECSSVITNIDEQDVLSSSSDDTSRYFIILCKVVLSYC